MKIPLTPIRFLMRAERQFGGKTGVIDGDRHWTYAEYAQRCRRLANLLLSWSLPAGGRVAFLSYNSHHLLEAYYGVPLAGGVLLPLNIRLTPDDFRYILDDAGVEVVFFHPDFFPQLDAIRGQLSKVSRFVMIEKGTDMPPWVERLTYEELLASQDDQLPFDVFSVDEDAVAELFYTSGTTGHPKGVMLTHRNLYLHALETTIALGVSDADIHLHTIPLFHVNGWGTPQFLTGMGGTHVLIGRFEPRAVLETIQRHRISTLYLVPTMAAALVNFPELKDYDASSIRMISLGGAAGNPHLVRQVEESLGCRCICGYGLTETSPVLTLSFPKDHLKTTEQRRPVLQAMTGYPIPGVEIEIVDGEDRPLPWDGKSIGEIVVRADGVMKGYWGLEAETRESLRGGWLHTGDMATIDPDGYVLIVDRKKDIIVSGGENISSIEVEKALLAHPAVLECAVIAVPDEAWGEVPKALVVLKPGQSVSEQELVHHCRSTLAHFKCPRTIEFQESLPKGGTGKILKKELREKFWQGYEKRIH